MNGVADLQPGQVHIEMVGDGVGRAADLDLVAHDIEHAAALQAGRGRLVEEAHRHLDIDQGVLADTQEIDVDGKVAHGIELHAVGDHPHLGAVHVEGEDGALEVPGVELLGDRPIVHGDGLRLMLVAIKDAGNAPVAACGAGATFA